MNAAEALADRDGVISLEVKQILKPDSPAELLPDSPAGNYVQLAISDTGGGMSRETQARAFDPFHSTKGHGRGLGLTAVQRIVRAHGGTVKVFSDLGRGTRFEVLDRSQPPVPAAKASPSELRANRASGTVLVIEDEDLLRRTVSKVFRDTGLAMIEAQDGETAVSLFRANPSAVDAVLLDMTLPAMSGKEVFRQLRRLRPDIRVVLTTAYSQDLQPMNAAAEKPWRYTRKPYKLAELVALLKSACLLSTD